LDRTAMALRGPNKTNKQASDFNLNSEQMKDVISRINSIEQMQDEIFKSYKGLLDAGLAKEIARFYLPVSTYTNIYVQFDLNNLIKFLRLRCAPDAQYEIQVYAEAMKKLAKQFFPISLNLEDEYKGASWLGKHEKEMIRTQRIPEEVNSVTYKKQLRELAVELEIELLS